MKNPPEVRDGDKGTITVRATFDRAGGRAFADLADGAPWLDDDDVVAVTVDPRLPEGWPPQAGDVWFDDLGHQWNAEARGGTVFLRDPSGGVYTPMYVLKVVEGTPWTLEFRRGKP